jgi:hypothetical protein
MLTCIEITGDITQRDIAVFGSHSKDFEFKPLTVSLNSRGGDVAAAMEIGRIIRSVDGWTDIPLDKRCYSSCALIFISGVYRRNYGELGLHRPYFASAPLSREQIEKQMPLMQAAVRKYVEEMGITDSFFERMYNTDPSNIEILRGDQSQKIVPLRDPVYDETITANGAQWYGLTTSEYRKRVLMASSSCPVVEWLCRESMMWGISPEDYLSRLGNVQASCGYSESELQLISATRLRDLDSLPFVAKHIACGVNIMSGK